jgi:large conductance mechanosensitive channel
MSFFTEFKEFAMRGNVLDLAVAVVIGAAFGKIITSLVDGIIMPVIGLLIGGINISNKSFVFGNAIIKWGLFLENVIDFTLIAFSIFIIIKIINTLKKEKKVEPKKSEEIALLQEIRDLLKTSASRDNA